MVIRRAPPTQSTQPTQRTQRTQRDKGKHTQRHEVMEEEGEDDNYSDDGGNDVFSEFEEDNEEDDYDEEDNDLTVSQQKAKAITVPIRKGGVPHAFASRTNGVYKTISRKFYNAYKKEKGGYFIMFSCLS
jgi:hypothetical protein